MRIEALESYLAAIARDAATLPHAALPRGIHPFVTISRDAGSDGRRLAEILLRRMQTLHRSPVFEGWRIVDAAVCGRILEERRLRVPFEALLPEKYRSEIEDLVQGLTDGFGARRTLEVFNVLRTLATFGKIIIVESGGACVTRDLPCGVHVRLVAAAGTRLRRMTEVRALPEEAARKVLAEHDRSRARLLRTCFKKDIRDPLLYDATWNADSVPFGQIASSILHLVRARASRAWRPSGGRVPAARIELPIAG